MMAWLFIIKRFPNQVHRMFGPICRLGRYDGMRMVSSLHPGLEIRSMRRVSCLMLRQGLIAGTISSVIFLLHIAALGVVLGHLSRILFLGDAMWFHLT